MTKLSLYLFLESTDRDEAFVREQDTFAWLDIGPDAAEGPAAFLEERAPQWQSSKNQGLPPEAGA